MIGLPSGGSGGFQGSSSATATTSATNKSSSPVVNVNFGEMGLAIAAIGILFILVMFFKHKT